MKVLIVVDMQNDFIDGALGTEEAKAIVPKVAQKIRTFPGSVLYTRDTHEENYLDTQEGHNLPVPHCIRGTKGWALHPDIQAFAKEEQIVDKPSFGSLDLPLAIRKLAGVDIESITLVGLCTDICVISNAMILKAAFPEVPIEVDAACCAGVTVDSHRNALDAMRACQIGIDHDSV